MDRAIVDLANAEFLAAKDARAKRSLIRELREYEKERPLEPAGWEWSALDTEWRLWDG